MLRWIWPISECTLRVTTTLFFTDLYAGDLFATGEGSKTGFSIEVTNVKIYHTSANYVYNDFKPTKDQWNHAAVVFRQTDKKMMVSIIKEI